MESTSDFCTITNIIDIKKKQQSTKLALVLKCLQVL